MDERRIKRVSEALREEISEIVGFELDDPRLRFVDVTGVSVTPDGRHARVQVALRGDAREQRDALAALEHARVYVRSEVARRLRLRRTPDLHFEEDRFDDVESRIEALLKRAQRTRGRE
jgi:ribosome-binding factor A